MICHCCDYKYETRIQDVYKCPQCAHIFRLYDGDADEYHANQYRDPKEGEGKRGANEVVDGKITENFHKNRKHIVEKRIRYAKEYLQQNDFCLDIGSGAGTFADLLDKHVASVECSELDPRLVDECERLGFETYHKGILELEDDKQYDIVFLWHVLEHIPSARQAVEKLKKIAKRKVIIEVPLLQALNGLGRTRTLTPPNSGFDGHYHYFSLRSFEMLVESAGFKVIEIKEGVQSPALFAVLEP